MAEVLRVEKRETRGTRQARRMRSRGQVPAVLYGHGKETVALTLPGDQLDQIMRHGAHVVELQGALRESALLRAIQWDSLGSHVLHVDLARVVQGEKVEVTLAIELRGDAPGTHDGGIVDHQLHEVEIECPVGAIPEKLQVNINHLELNGEITAGELVLPAGARLLVDPQTIVAQCVVVGEGPEAEAGEPSTAEPEVIGRRPDEEGESEE